MTKKLVISLILLILPVVLRAQESLYHVSYQRQLWESERDYRIRRQALSAARDQRIRGLESFLRKKEIAAEAKERARKDYVQSRYDRKPASESQWEYEAKLYRKTAYERSMHERSRLQHLQVMDRRAHAKETILKKYQSQETYYRDHEPWNE